MASRVVLDGATSLAWQALERRRRAVEIALALAAVAYMALLVERALGAEAMLVGGYALLAAAGSHQFGWERRQLALLAASVVGDERMRQESARLVLWERGSLTFLGMMALLYASDRFLPVIELGRFLFVAGISVLTWFMIILMRSTTASRLVEAVQWELAEATGPMKVSALASLAMPFAFAIGVMSFLIVTPGPPDAIEGAATVTYGLFVILGLRWFRGARLTIVAQERQRGESPGSEAFLWGWEHASYTFTLIVFSMLLGLHRGPEPEGGPLTLVWVLALSAWAGLAFAFVWRRRAAPAGPATVTLPSHGAGVGEGTLDLAPVTGGEVTGGGLGARRP